jgi:hypothetical protein
VLVAGGLAAVFVLGSPRWSHTYAASVIDPPRSVADFTLTDQHGRAFSLGRERYKLALIYFGYGLATGSTVIDGPEQSGLMPCRQTLHRVIMALRQKLENKEPEERV